MIIDVLYAPAFSFNEAQMVSGALFQVTYVGQGVSPGTGGNGGVSDYRLLTHKPDLGTAAALDVPATGNAAPTEVVLGSDTRLAGTGGTSDYNALSNKPHLGTVAALDVPLPQSAVQDLDGTFVSTTDARLSDPRTPLPHTHPESDVDGLATDLATITADVSAHALSIGTNAGAITALQGRLTIDETAIDAGVAALLALQGRATADEALIAANTAGLAGKVGTTDARLSDARVPLAHTHLKAQITDFPTLGPLAALDVDGTTITSAGGKISAVGGGVSGTKVTAVHVFGDSFSDYGNYTGLCYTNGTTWAAKVAGLLGVYTGLRFAGSQTPNLGTNYAVVSSEMDANPHGSQYWIDNQIALYLTDVTVHVPGDAVCLWPGPAVLYDAIPLQTSGTDQTAHLIAQIALLQTRIINLIAAGVAHIFLLNTPNASRAPAQIALGATTIANANTLSILWNTQLAAMAAAFPQVTIVDIESLYVEICNSPSTYGISNLTTIPPNGSTSAVINTYLYFDGVHPTDNVHGFIADLVASYIQSTFGLIGPFGKQGIQGLQGLAGGGLTPGTVSTLAAGAPATMSITGVTPNQVLNLGIPQGLAGIAGSSGQTKNYLLNANFETIPIGWYKALGINNWFGDMWYFGGSASITGIVQWGHTGTLLGTNPQSAKTINIWINTGQVTLAATDYASMFTWIEGPVYATICDQACTIEFWFNPKVAGVYSMSVRNSAKTQSFVHAFTVTAGQINTWLHISFVLPVPASNAGFTYANGTVGLIIGFSLGAGSTFQTSTLDAWQAGNFTAATGQVNMLAGNNPSIGQFGLYAGAAPANYIFADPMATAKAAQRYFGYVGNKLTNPLQLPGDFAGPGILSGYPYGIRYTAYYYSGTICHCSGSFEAEMYQVPIMAILGSTISGSVVTTAGLAIGGGFIIAELASIGKYGIGRLQATSGTPFVVGGIYLFNYIADARPALGWV